MADIKNKYNERQNDKFILSFVILLLLFLFFSIILSPLHELCKNQNIKFIVLLLPFLLSTIFFFVINNFFKIFPNKILIFTSNNKISYKKIILSFFIWFFTLIILFLVKYLINYNNYFIQFDKTDFIILTFVSFLFLFIQSIFEELLFRRFLLVGLKSYFSYNWFVILMSSILFAVMHINNPEIKYLGYFAIIYYLISGVFLSIICLYDNGIELSSGFHFANNLFGTLILTNKWQVFQTKAIFIDKSFPKISWDIWVILLILYPFFLFLYFKISKKKF